MSGGPRHRRRRTAAEAADAILAELRKLDRNGSTLTMRVIGRRLQTDPRHIRRVAEENGLSHVIGQTLVPVDR